MNHNREKSSVHVSSPVSDSGCGGTPAASTAQDVAELLRRHAAECEQYLRDCLTRLGSAPPRLVEAMSYSLLAGGKRLRPALVLECCAACAPHSGLNTPDSGLNKSALAAAGAIELIHTFSLVHDDLPAMDDDDLRRGRATNHKVFGEAMAILAGDAMVTLAFEILATDAQPKVVAALVRELAAASGPGGMIGGQVLDIDAENKSLSLKDLQHVHRMKTGALLTVACRLGAISAQAEPAKLASITDYGRHLGLAFQIVDDLLDVTSTPEQMGKATQKDATAGKNTYPALMGIGASRTEAETHVHLAVSALKDLGPKAEGLRSLGQFVCGRSS